MDEQWLDQEITVCAECLTAACWQGIFMYQSAQHADVTKVSRRKLIEMGFEHTDYMKTDDELANR